MKKKGGVKSKRSYDIKKTFLFRLLIACIILLFVLVIVWIFVYEAPVKEEGFGLPTLRFGEEADTDILLEVLDYNLTDNNQTIQVNINWTSGVDVLEAIFIEFKKSDRDCNITVSPMVPPVGKRNATYTIFSRNTNCEPSNFTNITNIDNITAIAGINVVITQIKDASSVKLYKGQNLTLNLSEYFSCNHNELVFNVSSGSKNVSVLNIDSNYTFYPDYGWFWVADVLINASCRFEYASQTFDITVSPNLTQTEILPNVTIYKNGNLTSVFDLDEFFVCDDEINYILNDFVINENNKIQIYKNSNNVVGIYSNSTKSYNGTVLPAQAMCGYGDYIRAYFYINYSNYTRPPANHPPEFNRTYCDDLIWNKNISYTLNMTKCWSDEDGDSLTLRYENRSNANLSISQNGVILTLTPNSNWIGIGYFYVYADDGKVNEDESGRVDFTVISSVVTNGTNATNTTLLNTEPKIKTSNPSSSIISNISNGSKTFTITAEHYQSIKWYLNGRLIGENASTYAFDNLKEGDIVKVEVINGTRIDSKTWNIKIAKNNIIETPFNYGKFIFYMILAVISMIIILVAWLLIAKKMHNKNKINLGFGVSQNSNNTNRNSSDYFNIQR